MSWEIKENGSLEESQVPLKDNMNKTGNFSHYYASTKWLESGSTTTPPQQFSPTVRISITWNNQGPALTWGSVASGGPGLVEADQYVPRRSQSEFRNSSYFYGPYFYLLIIYQFQLPFKHFKILAFTSSKMDMPVLLNTPFYYLVPYQALVSDSEEWPVVWQSWLQGALGGLPGMTYQC